MENMPSVFPSTLEEALALLYVKNQDLSRKTPAEILDLYYEAYTEIMHDRIIKYREGFFKNMHEEIRKP